ncbi:unnamed protein product [Schistosoma guineensis]|uniref:OCIA domain-containing protein 1 n=2 Tax=Schistosoma TaxID=6181 RepID=A0A094ZR68_SCHHA|nr:hypothetical protein MS3_00007388 [Schistosoma haematobium]CAH8578505.1 unnamed protein product [Schistosoma guineensis]CAH8582720.1 unnamed protein product [Schistosoma curassoni]CAH8585607.1 unnamed protein product [Schistosoma bovis]KAH9582729.1 hypothetical protein MS3_00007388 [Schistosoma haematobium]CAH8599539.1 unnamed protein product [Schistosoma haematobium]
MLPPNDLLQLTDEDVKTLKKCRQISFWRGSLPFSIGALLAVSAADKYGWFSKRKMFRFPSYFFGVTIGYFVGQFSCAGECRRMFLQLNNSRIKDQILRMETPGTFQPTPGSPIIVNTPVEKHPPMNYEQRRQFYNKQREQSTSPYPSSKPPTTIEEEDTTSDQTNSSLSYFDNDRPISSFYYDNDVYRPKEE